MPYKSPAPSAARLTTEDKGKPYTAPKFDPPPEEIYYDDDGQPVWPANIGPIEGDDGKPATHADMSPEMAKMLTQALIGTGVGAAAPYAVDAVTTLYNKGINTFGGDLMPNDADRAALVQIAKRLHADKVTPQEALARIRDAAPKPYFLLDAAGENLVTLGRETARTPGPARQIAKTSLDGRQMDQAGRIMGDIHSLIDPTTDYRATADALIEERRTRSVPFFEAATKRGMHVSPAIQKLMETPTGKEAIAEAIRIAADEGVDISKTFASDNPTRFQNRGENMKVLSYFKQGLDRRIEKGMQQNAFGEPVHTSETRAWVKNIKSPLLAEMKHMNPDYAKALAEYSSYSEHMEALAKGRQFMTEDFDVTTKELAEMTPADRQLFRAGAVRGLRDIVHESEDGINKVRKIFGSPGKRERLKQIFVDPRLFTEFEKRMEQEGKMFRNRETVDRVTKNITAAAGADAAESGLDDGFWKRLMELDIKGGARDALANAANRARGLTPNVREKVGQRLFDPTQASRTLRAIQTQGKAAASRAALLKKGAAGLALLGGGTGAGASLLPDDPTPEDEGDY